MAKIECEKYKRPYKEIRKGDIIRVMPANNYHRMIIDSEARLIAVSMISGNREFNKDFSGWKIDKFAGWLKRKFPGIEDVYHYPNGEITIVIK
jgi:hypothetical protein